MAFPRFINRALATLLLLVIVSGWFVAPLASWVPKLLGWEHVVLLGLDHCDLHLAIIHADGSVDHRDHGPDCAGHDLLGDAEDPEHASDHSKHGVHMPQFERDMQPGVPVPPPVVRISPLALGVSDAVDPASFSAGETVVPAYYSPPSELQRTTVLLI